MKIIREPVPAPRERITNFITCGTVVSVFLADDYLRRTFTTGVLDNFPICEKSEIRQLGQALIELADQEGVK